MLKTGNGLKWVRCAHVSVQSDCKVLVWGPSLCWGGPDGVECARTLADSVSGRGGGSQSLMSWTSQPGGLLQTHALQLQWPPNLSNVNHCPCCCRACVEWMHEWMPRGTVPFFTPSLVSLFTDENSGRLPKCLTFPIDLASVCRKAIMSLPSHSATLPKVE